MKLKSCLLLLLLAAVCVRAQTNDLATLLQKGLLEEQANRNLNAAIMDYQSLAAQYDKDRQIAATAIFRLGECYRAQGKTNEAAAQYQRILRDFSSEQTLVTLSRQNLVGLGVAAPESTATTPISPIDKLTILQTQYRMLKEQVEQAQAAHDLYETARILRDDHLKELVQKLYDSKGRTEKEQTEYLDQLNEYLNPLYQQKDRELAALQSEILHLGTGQTTPTSAVEPVSTLSEEDQEIQRLQKLLHDSPDLINVQNSDKQTPLGKAANRGWFKAAALLLEQGADINAADDNALNQAVRVGNRAMVEFLLSHGAETGAKTGTDTPLHTAAAKGFQGVVEVLLNHKADVNALNNAGATPLHLAAIYNHAKIAALLLTNDANPNVEDTSGRTPLSYAAGLDSPEILVALLLDAKADPNGGKMDAPLLVALFYNNIAAAELLLEHGANPNFVGTVSWSAGGTIPGKTTPLVTALASGKLPLVKLLLKYKLDPNDPQSGASPLFGALENPAMLGTLLDAGAKVDWQKAKHGEPMHFTASGQNQVAIMGVPDTDPTPLDIAVAQTKTESVEILLKHGANPNVRDADGKTALHYAADRYSQPLDQKVFELLLDHGADPNTRNRFGMTPLAYVKNQRDQTNIVEIAELLRQHGALDQLPEWDQIQVSRPSKNFSKALITKGRNDWNRFTLLELLAVQYQFLSSSPAGENSSWHNMDMLGMNLQNNSLAFPDLAHVRIHRPAPDGKSWTEQSVDLESALQAGDGTKNLPLAWGDVVEIPETDHLVQSSWHGFSSQVMTNWANLLARQVDIIVKGQTNHINLTLDVQNAMTSGIDGIVRSAVAHGVFWIEPVLFKSNLVLSSSDLSRVKVTRRDSAPGQPREWLVDCSDPANKPAPDFWLRDGDVIEVPDKP